MLVGLGTRGEVADVQILATKPFRHSHIAAQVKLLTVPAVQGHRSVRGRRRIERHPLALRRLSEDDQLLAALARNRDGGAQTGIPLSK